MLATTLRWEIVGEPVRVIEIAPGAVATDEFSLVRFDGDAERGRRGLRRATSRCVADDVADAIAWTLSRPPHVNIDLLVVRPRAQASNTKIARTRASVIAATSRDRGLTTCRRGMADPASRRVGGCPIAPPVPPRTPGLDHSGAAPPRRWARPALPRIALGGLTALGASLLALAVPQVLRAIVNGPLLTDGSRAASSSARSWSSCSASSRPFLVWCRRALIPTPGTAVERDMRTDLFRHLLDLPVEFHDRWPGGQLLSRVMSDLSTIRRWTVFGLVMLAGQRRRPSSSASALMIWTSPVLGLVYLAGAVPMIWLGFRFREDYKVVARRARDQAGDLATTVEESVHGIRVLKAFGRGEDALDDFARQADELRDTEVHKARTLSRVSFALGRDPRGGPRGLARPSACRSPPAASSASARSSRSSRRPPSSTPRRAPRHAARDDARRQGRDRPLHAGDGHRVDRAGPRDPVALPAADPAGSRVELRGVAASRHPAAASAGRRARRRRPRARAGGDPGARRAHRQRQDDAAAARAPALRRHGRARSASTASTCAT